MNNPTSTFVSEFNKITEQCAIFGFVTRDSTLQREACQKLQNLDALIKVEKESAIASGDDDYANLLLGCECATDALASEIRMWILIKEGRPDEAWDALVNAESNLVSAMKAHEGFAHLEDNIRRLAAIEQLVFPPQFFLSSGMIVKSQICSICGGEYEDCEHVKGRPYMGKLCTVRLIPSAVDHVAIVENPANKRCRIVKFSTDGGYRNRMTWLVEPRSGSAEEPAESLTVEGILAISTPSENNNQKDFTFVE